MGTLVEGAPLRDPKTAAWTLRGAATTLALAVVGLHRELKDSGVEYSQEEICRLLENMTDRLVSDVLCAAETLADKEPHERPEVTT